VSRGRPPRRPAHLTTGHAATWQETDAVTAYVHRAPYPEELIARLGAEARGGDALELGCGSGAVTRALAPLVRSIDAIDISPLMLAEARRLPGGSHSGITWIEGAAESAPIGGPYQLALSASALHWMEWDVVLPRIASVLDIDARLAVVEMSVGRDTPWRAAEDELFPEFSVFQDFERFDLPELLAELDLWTVEERTEFGPVSFVQRVEDYVEQFHSSSSLRRSGLGEVRAQEFDDRLGALVEPYARDGRLELDVRAALALGRPHPAPHGGA
jgi:ubiquinone/menaquinone biosynthesis C-methylase UbiE